MKLNKRIASQDEKSRISNDIGWCQRHHQTLEGFPYGDDFAGPGGIHLELYVPVGTPQETCETALKQGYAQRDVVKHSVVECPAEWFQAANAA